MRKVMVAVATATALLVATAGPAASAPSPFVGTWVAVDIDGSNLRLTIGGGPNPIINLYDDGATVCSVNVPPDIPARARGAGTITESTISSTVDVVCLTPAPVNIGPFAFELEAQPDGTLTDMLGVVYTRI